jgi:predicted dehydrogenase
MPAPIRLALAGTGLFARDAHLPALQALGDTFEIVALYSYKRSSADALLAQLPRPVEVYESLPDLLARDDVEAVNLVLPIHVLPEAIEQSLRAGKHVISEKPAAPDVETGRKLLELYASQRGPVWMVAENYRYDPAFVRAAEIVKRGDIGRPLACHWTMYNNMNPDNKYFFSMWRRTAGNFPGGFLLDGGVHHIASLRLILGEIISVSAITSLLREDLPPVDTVSAALLFGSGAVGTYQITYAVGSPWNTPLHIVGENGALTVQTGKLKVTRGDQTDEIDVSGVNTIQAELAAFAAAIREGQPFVSSPQEAVQDVAVIEAMLRSAETGQRITPERVV